MCFLRLGELQNCSGPYKGYTYEVALDADGRFDSFVPFSYGIGTANATWKELSTNDLYSHNGVLVQSKDVLAKYACQLLGYNFANTVGAVSNASWAACAYEGAENTYQTATLTNTMLEDNKVQLLSARVEKACIGQQFLYKSMNCNDVAAQNHALLVTLPANPSYNVPFAKINVTYANSNILRDLYVSLNDHNEIEVTSNKGEVFRGYLVYPITVNSFKLYFRPQDFVTNGFVLDNSFKLNNHSVVYSANMPLPANCECTLKDYNVPNNNCNVFAHTGQYAFVLDAGENVGTEFILHSNASGKNPVTTAEFSRKYKAMVWVHNSSPDKTELVMRLTNAAGQPIAGTTEIKTSKATPYVVAGDWSLLRIDFDLSDPTAQGAYAHVFVRNNAYIFSKWAANYDDLRVLPYHADMTNWVFDHRFNRVTSGLDVDNFASYTSYDNRGRVVKSSVEIQNDGKTPVQKFLYNDQKKN